MTHLICIHSTQKLVRSPYFRFDEMRSSVLSHSLTSSYLKMMPNLKVGDIEEISLSTKQMALDFDDVQVFTLPLPFK